MSDKAENQAELCKQYFEQKKYYLLARMVARKSVKVAVRRMALDYLAQAKEDGLEAAGSIWSETRNKGLAKFVLEREWLNSSEYHTKTRILTLLLHDKIGEYQKQRELIYAEIKILLEVAENPTETELGPRAAKALRELPDSQLENITEIWQETRSNLLLEIIKECNYQPKRKYIKIWLALYLPERAAIIIKGGVVVVSVLLEALESKDITIVERAKELLPKLTNKEAHASICEKFLLSENPFLEQVAIEQGWLPVEVSQKALFLFLTEQWEKYDQLDFDQRLMRLNYQTPSATKDLRRRIIDKVRQVGRPDYLEILTGGKNGLVEKKTTAQEAETLLGILASQQQWAELWDLLPSLPLKYSRQAVLKLLEVGWQPSSADGRANLQKLARLAQAEMYADEKELQQNWPLFYERMQAKLKISEKRINPENIKDVAFAYRQPWLALALAGQRVLIWNLQTAAIEKVSKIKSNKTLGLLTFSSNDILWVAETSEVKNKACAVYRWEAATNEFCKIGEHLGAVTALRAVENNLLISAGLDGRVVVWDAETGLKKYEFSVREDDLGSSEDTELANAIAENYAKMATDEVIGLDIAPDRKSVAILHNRITFRTLPDLEPIHTVQLKDLNFGKLQKGWFAGSQDFFFKYSPVPICRLAMPDKIPNYFCELFTPPLRHEFAEYHSLKAVGASFMIDLNGKIKITYQSHYPPTFQYYEVFKNRGYEWVKGIKFSPDDCYLAVLDNKNRFLILDARFAWLQKIFSEPITTLIPKQIKLLQQIRQEYASVLPKEVLNALNYIEGVILWHKRYQIEIDEIITVQSGEFDIELE